MSWFFASSSTFQNVNDETINNRPINLDIVNTYSRTTHLPEATTEVLFAISFDIADTATILYLCYPNEIARDADFDLLEIQAALPSSNKAGYHTSADFQNGSGQDIKNKTFNLDTSSSYYKSSKKPIGTSESLFSIALVYNNKHKPEYLYYEDEATRDADFDVIETAVSSIGTSSFLTFTPSKAAITGSAAGAWVTRNLGIGANKVVQVQIENSRTIKTVGVREVGSTMPSFALGTASLYLLVKTDNSGNIEIFSNNIGAIFTQVSILL